MKVLGNIRTCMSEALMETEPNKSFEFLTTDLFNRTLMIQNS
jgi:hypothetical protein